MQVTNISGSPITFGATHIKRGATGTVDDSLTVLVQFYALQNKVTYTGGTQYIGSWANRPSAATLGAGASITINDFPLTGQSNWVSDGAFWRHAGVIPLESVAIPMIVPSSGSMANNGVITLTTALPAVYGSCYLYLPANAISAGSAAGIYYTAMSSTTVGTVYNNVYTTGHPTVPVAPVSFVTTGPGAYTQVTTSINMLTTLIPASSMALQGSLKLMTGFFFPNSAGAKTVGITFGGTSVYNKGRTTSVLDSLLLDIRNAGVQNKNVSINSINGGPAIASAQSPVELAVDTSVNVNLVHTLQLAAATDYVMIRATDITLAPF